MNRNHARNLILMATLLPALILAGCNGATGRPLLPVAEYEK